MVWDSILKYLPLASSGYRQQVFPCLGKDGVEDLWTRTGEREGETRTQMGDIEGKRHTIVETWDVDRHPRSP